MLLHPNLLPFGDARSKDRWHATHSIRHVLVHWIRVIVCARARVSREDGVSVAFGFVFVLEVDNFDRGAKKSSSGSEYWEMLGEWSTGRGLRIAHTV